MRNLRLIIAYDGSRYHGWQHQPGLITVERRVGEVLAPIVQHRVALTVAGRTDAGVHARGQVANFRTPSTVPVDRLRRAADNRLEPDINLLRIDETTESFNARFDALGKHYRYGLWLARDKPPWDLARTLWHWHRPADLDAARAAARRLLGRHDFKSFETTGSEVGRSTICTLTRVDLRQAGRCLWIDVEGDRFVHNMIRILAGTLMDVARGRIAPGRIPAILDARDRRAAGPTAPARGLTLMQVFYDEARAMAVPAPAAPDEDTP